MESEHFIGKVALRGVVERGGAVLVCKCEGDAPWQFPGGRLHKNEDPKAAMVREVKEELGTDLTVGDVFYTEQYIHVKSNTPQVFLFFRCSMQGDPRIVDPVEIGEFRWVSKEELKTLPMWEDCRRAADAYLAKP